MSGSTTQIPEELLHRIFEEARKAYPSECCGFLTGPSENTVADSIYPCTNARADGNHPTAEGRGAETAYVIEGADLLALNKSFDGPQPAKVIYHSHPNGRAYFSDTDQQVATSPWGDGPMYPVEQLVVGIDEERVVHAKLFAWSDDANKFRETNEYPGASI